MRVRPLLLAASALAVAGCAGNVTIPSPGLDHPANPQAAAAPLPPLPSVPDATAPTGGGMQGMNHGSMRGMDHGSSMPGMDHGSMQGMQGMRGMPDTDHGAHEHGASAAGRPGSEESVDRTVEVTALDTMRFKPAALAVRRDETVRFVVTNAGRIDHEFVIGTPEEQRAHERMMRQMPNMEHEDPNALTLAPGETKTLVWQFGGAGVVELACHVPGHYQAGMVSAVNVRPAAAPTKGKPETNTGMNPGMSGMGGPHHGH